MNLNQALYIAEGAAKQLGDMDGCPKYGTAINILVKRVRAELLQHKESFAAGHKVIPVTRDRGAMTNASMGRGTIAKAHLK